MVTKDCSRATLLIIMKSKDFPDCFYRVSVKGLFVRDEKILLVKEPPELSGQWERPGGGLDFGENIQKGVEREIEEELKLDVISVAKQPTYVWTCYFTNQRNVDWYYSLVLAYKIELESLDFSLTEEAEEIGFFSKEELQTLPLFHQSLPLRELFNPEDF